MKAEELSDDESLSAPDTLGVIYLRGISPPILPFVCLTHDESSPLQQQQLLQYVRARSVDQSIFSVAPIPEGLHFTYHECKVAVLGKQGCGKSSTIANLCNIESGSTYVETPGLHVRQTYWAARGADRYHLIRFVFYEAGSAASARYSYMQLTALEHASLVVHVVSTVDRSSLDGVNVSHPKDTSILLLTKCDLLLHCQVSLSDILRSGQRAVRLTNLTRGQEGYSEEARQLEVTQVLNTLADMYLQQQLSSTISS